MNVSYAPLTYLVCFPYCHNASITSTIAKLLRFPSCRPQHNYLGRILLLILDHIDIIDPVYYFSVHSVGVSFEVGHKTSDMGFIRPVDEAS